MKFSAKSLMQVALVALLILGCVMILLPFVGAMLFAAILCVVTWPVYERLHARTKGRDTLAAGIMTAVLTLACLVPLALLAGSAADGAVTIAEKLKPWLQDGVKDTPAWLKAVPFAGPQIDDYWHTLAESREELMKAVRQLYEPARRALLGIGTFIGHGVLQVALVLFIGFFGYRDGRRFAAGLKNAAERLAGGLGDEMVELAKSTVSGVMFGIVGTAAAQSLVALAGLIIAGVPAPLLLAGATFFLSMVPIGPPLVWGGAAIWLYNHGETGWAVFMAAYGFFVISSVDNVIKPLLISRSANLSFLLIVLGVFGGVLAFGFIGIFLGPTLLALGAVLLRRWLETPRPLPEEGDG